MKSHLKVLVFYPETKPDEAFEKFVREYAEAIKLQELRLANEMYLVIAVCADKENNQLVIKGAEVSPERETSQLSDVKIPYKQF